MRFNQEGRTRLRKGGLVLMFLAIRMIGSHTAACPAADWGLDAPVFSIEAKDEPLQNVLQRISQATGYEIIVNPKWGDTPVTIKLENATLEDGFRAILKKLAGSSHALIIQEEEKRVSLFLYPSSKSPDIPSFADRQSRLPFQPPFPIFQSAPQRRAGSDAPSEEPEPQERIEPKGGEPQPSDTPIDPGRVERPGESPSLPRQP